MKKPAKRTTNDMTLFDIRKTVNVLLDRINVLEKKIDVLSKDMKFVRTEVLEELQWIRNNIKKKQTTNDEEVPESWDDDEDREETRYERIVIAAFRKPVTGMRGKVVKYKEPAKVLYLKGILSNKEWDKGYIWTDDPDEAAFNVEQDWDCSTVYNRMLSMQEENHGGLTFGLDHERYDHPEIVMLVRDNKYDDWEVRRKGKKAIR